MSDNWLLRSKFLIPQFPEHHIPRTYLANLIHQKSRQYVFVVAPAGYGKTILLTEVAHYDNTPTVWVRLDTQDNNPYRFLACLLEGIGTIIDDVKIVEKNAVSPVAALTSLLNVLHENKIHSWRLILDAVEHINDTLTVQLITLLLDNLPSNTQVLLGGRTISSLPVARWRVTHAILEIGFEDLRFSRDEIIDWFSPQSVDMEYVWEKTEGWAVALQIVHQSLSDQMDHLSGTHPYLFDYFYTEVFSLQSAAQQDFLLRTAVFDELNPDICVAIPGDVDFHSLNKSGLFLNPIDTSIRRFRYHPLFREFLLEYLCTNNRLYQAAHHTAGEYYQQQHKTYLAIHHFIQARDISQAVKYLCADYIELIQQGSVSNLQQILLGLNADDYESWPELHLITARVMRHTGQLREAFDMLADLTQLPVDGHLLAQTYLELTSIAHSQGRYDYAYELAQRNIAIIEESNRLHVLAMMQLARCAGFTKGMDEGRRIAEQGFCLLHTSPHIFTNHDYAQTLQILGQICWWHGDVKLAIQYCREALTILDEEPSALRASILLTLATPLLYRKEYDDALGLSKQALDMCEQLQLCEMLPEAYAVSGNILTRMGDLPRAENLLRQAIQQANHIGGANYARVMASGYLAQNLAQQGDIDTAKAIAEHALPTTTQDTIVYETYVCQSVLADILLDAQQIHLAKRIFDQLIILGEQRQYRIPLAMAYFGMAYILLNEQERETALRYSKESLKLLEPSMLQQLYLDQHERAFVVCGSLSQQIPGNPFIEQVYTTLSPARIVVIEQPLAVIEVCTLGRFEAKRNGQVIPPSAFSSTKARDLLAYFIVHRSHPVPLDRVMDTLWQESYGNTSAFHTALYRLRLALRQDDEKTRYISSEMGEYYLDRSHFSIDVDQFDRFIERAKKLPESQAVPLWEAAIGLYRGDYFANLYHAWLTTERERLSKSFIEATLKLSQHYLSRNQYDSAENLICHALEIEHFEESLYSQLMRVYVATNDQQKFSDTYHTLCKQLRELELEPSHKIKQLFRRVLSEKR